MFAAIVRKLAKYSNPAMVDFGDYAITTFNRMVWIDKDDRANRVGAALLMPDASLALLILSPIVVMGKWYRLNN